MSVRGPRRDTRMQCRIDKERVREGREGREDGASESETNIGRARYARTIARERERGERKGETESIEREMKQNTE